MPTSSKEDDSEYCDDECIEDALFKQNLLLFLSDNGVIDPRHTKITD